MNTQNYYDTLLKIIDTKIYMCTKDGANCAIYIPGLMEAKEIIKASDFLFNNEAK